jgi:hypothetical protein
MLPHSSGSKCVGQVVLKFGLIHCSSFRHRTLRWTHGHISVVGFGSLALYINCVCSTLTSGRYKCYVQAVDILVSDIYVHTMNSSIVKGWVV